LGVIGEFHPMTKTFKVYSETLDRFFVANNIESYPMSVSEAVIATAEKKKVAVMISVISKKTYSVLHYLCSPVNPKDKTFKQVCELLQHNFTPFMIGSRRIL